MRMIKRTLTVLLAATVGLGLATPAALASHFRASTTATSYSGGVITWNLTEAWAKDNADTLFDDGSDVEVTLDGNPTSATVSDPVNAEDLSNPLFDVTTQRADIDINTLLGTPGLYQAYVSSCCRVNGIANTSDDGSESQAIGFRVRNDQSVDMPPVFDHPSVYTLIPVSGSGPGLSLDYRATDPDGAAVTYSYVTETEEPAYGATAMACSELSNGVFRLSASLCAPGEVFTDIYTAGTYWAVKVRATDADGAFSETDTLLRVPTVPQPYIDEATFEKGTGTFTVLLQDSDTLVDSYTVTCTNQADPDDVRSASSPEREVKVTGLSPNAVYDCVTSAKNGVGTGTSSESYTASTPTFSTQSISFPALKSHQLTKSTVPVLATATSALPVSYTSATPSVCTVDAGAVTLRRTGTCTITAHQEGDSTFDQAAPVSRSFQVTPTVTSTPSLAVRHKIVNASRVPTTCRLSGQHVNRCYVAAYTTVNGRRVLVGRGHSVAGSGAAKAVSVTLNATGRRLSHRPGGARLRLVAHVHPDHGASRTATARTLVVAPRVALRPVYFAVDSARLKKRDRDYLNSVRRHLGASRSITCVGSTDSQAGRAYNKSLARHRAQAVCGVLKHGSKVRIRIVSLGEANSKYTNATVKGRSLNRRVETTLRY